MVSGSFIDSFADKTLQVTGPSAYRVDKKRIYPAPDECTDYSWNAGENQYRVAFFRMIGYYLDLTDATKGNRPEHQSRWNCEGSFCSWTYEKNKSKAEYDRLISRVKSGISVFRRKHE